MDHHPSQPEITPSIGDRIEPQQELRYFAPLQWVVDAEPFSATADLATEPYSGPQEIITTEQTGEMYKEAGLDTDHNQEADDDRYEPAGNEQFSQAFDAALRAATDQGRRWNVEYGETTVEEAVRFEDLPEFVRDILPPDHASVPEHTDSTYVRAMELLGASAATQTPLTYEIRFAHRVQTNAGIVDNVVVYRLKREMDAQGAYITADGERSVYQHRHAYNERHHLPRLHSEGGALTRGEVRELADHLSAANGQSAFRIVPETMPAAGTAQRLERNEITSAAQARHRRSGAGADSLLQRAVRRLHGTH